jgi:hypothetical protein
MTINLDELERLAKAAAPGPWLYFVPCNTPSLNPDQAAFLVGPRMRAMDKSQGFAVEDAAHIAAANPATILELVAEVRRLREDAARLSWLEDFHRLRAAEGLSANYGDVGTNIIERTSDGWMLDRELDRDQPEFETLREAIDAARKEKP